MTVGLLALAAAIAFYGWAGRYSLQVALKPARVELHSQERDLSWQERLNRDLGIKTSPPEPTIGAYRLDRLTGEVCFIYGIYGIKWCGDEPGDGDPYRVPDEEEAAEESAEEEAELQTAQPPEPSTGNPYLDILNQGNRQRPAEESERPD